MAKKNRVRNASSARKPGKRGKPSARVEFVRHRIAAAARTADSTMPSTKAFGFGDPITSAFVPPFGLQGQELSCHVTWDRAYSLQYLRFECEAAVRCLHVYNALDNGLAITAEGNEFEVTAVRENGYVGFVLGTKVLDVADVLVSVRTVGAFSQGSSTLGVSKAFDLRLFRPDLRVVSCPDTIRVGFPPGSAKPLVEPKIVIENLGKGTVLAVLLPGGGSKVRFVDYFELNKERDRYTSLLIQRLDSMKADYPQLLGLIEIWQTLFRAIQSQDENVLLSSMERLRTQMASAERGEPDFIQDLSEAFLDAFLATFALDLRFKAWIQTLESTREQRIVLLNPLASLSLKGGSLQLPLEIRHYDLLGHEYPRLQLGPVRVESSASGLLPAFELLGIPLSNLLHEQSNLSERPGKEVENESR